MIDALEGIRPALAAVLAQHQIPAAMIAVAHGEQAPHVWLEVPYPQAQGVAYVGTPADVLFPVASVTKLATALAILRAISDGLMTLDDELSLFLPLAPAAVPGVTVRRLLTHTAGLPDDLSLPAGADWIQYYPSSPMTATPGAAFSYSSVAYDLLGAVIEKVTTWPYHKFVKAAVLDSLGVSGYFGWEPTPSMNLTGFFANNYNDPDRRFLGKASGGLITTAAGALAVGRAFAWPPNGLDVNPQLLLDARADQTGGIAAQPGNIWLPMEPWGLGPEIRGLSAQKDNRHYSPSHAGPSSFGHFGASGSFVWCDPDVDLSFAILSARTTGPNPWHYYAWRQVGDLIYQAAA